MTDVQIRPIEVRDVEDFHACLDAICKERLYLGSYEAPAIEATRAFVESMVERDLPQFVAEDDGRIVGWVDITPHSRPLFKHVGELGMGVLHAYRGKGVGHRLLQVALDKAKEIELKRVELEVYAHNHTAIKLYETMGFAHEGRKLKAALLDQGYVDVIVMGLLFV